MLYTMKELLSVARKNHFAVPAFNISSFDMLEVYNGRGGGSECACDS